MSRGEDAQLTPPPRTTSRCGVSARTAVSLMTVVAALTMGGCGKKGPPMPPLIRIPVAPPEATAVRRGSIVDIQFVVPRANTDGSTPADVERVDVYGLTGAAVSGDDIVRRGSRVGTVLVNPPPDPDEDPDAVTPPDPGAPPKRGIDQGTMGRVSEDIAAISASVARLYVSVGVSRSGRRGPSSPLAPVPLGPAPPPPAAPVLTYTETSISVAWTPPPVAAPSATMAVHVYESAPVPRRLSDRPQPEPPFADSRIEWGAERCYALRTVQSAGGLTMESEASEAACVRLTDTFPPAAPTGLTAVASAGAISLIWNANPEKDVAGYLVLRAIAPVDTPAAITPAPVTETTFSDALAGGARVTYAVQAVDQAGNVSQMSAPIEESAR